MKILFLTISDFNTPSSRVRIYQYLPYLTESKIDYRVFQALDEKPPIKYLTYILEKIRLLFLPFQLMFIGDRYDILVIQRVIVPRMTSWIMPLLFKNIIYEFDDALFSNNEVNGGVLNRFLNRMDKRQFDYLLKKSKTIITTNDYNKDYASRYCANVVVIPGPIDTNRYFTASDRPRDKIVIGWIGSLTTSPYVKEIEPALNIIKKKYPDVEFSFIGFDRSIKLSIPCIFKKWSYEQEISDLEEITIGIMPMPVTEWTQGKGAYKRLQYMSMSMPSVSSHIGVVSEIVKNGVNGLIAWVNEEWVNKL